MDFAIFFQEQQNLVDNILYEHKRYLYEQIDWDARALLITGQRGVGKTTLMLQHLKQNYPNSQKALYISVDNPYFKTISLYEFATTFEKFGGEVLYIDEIHKYKDWAVHIKSLYDSTKLKMVISGSSMIQINKQQADLSRRVKEYKLANLSFREYLLFKGVFDFESISIEEVFENHFEIASSIKKEIKPLEYFRAYLDEGCYPFSVMSQKSQTHYLIGIINQILEVDMPYVSNIKYSHIDKIKKLIYLLSSSVPLKPNISKLSIAIEVSRSTLLEYLHYLELGNLINVVNQKARGYNTISKPDKLFIHNTNLQKAISHDINIGTAREVFFVNQLKSANQNSARLLDDYLLLSNSGDFIIDGKWIVEVGGKNKSFNQIKDLANSFVVADDIEVGFGAKIPLWLFGFLY